jgi:hypothetical protein
VSWLISVCNFAEFAVKSELTIFACPPAITCVTVVNVERGHTPSLPNMISRFNIARTHRDNIRKFTGKICTRPVLIWRRSCDTLNSLVRCSTQRACALRIHDMSSSLARVVFFGRAHGGSGSWHGPVASYKQYPRRSGEGVDRQETATSHLDIAEQYRDRSMDGRGFAASQPEKWKNQFGLSSGP